MKTAAQILDENFKHKGVSNIISKQGLVYKGTIKAMETYATQQTSDLTTQLAKANSDKEKLGKILKEHLAEIESSIKLLKGYEGNEVMNSLSKLNVGYEDKATQIKQTLQDCGITL